MKSKFLSVCLSLLMSIGLWLYVTNVVSPESSETFRNIPVELQSVALLEERGLVITSISHPEIDLQLSGNRTDLMQLNSGNIRVYADVSKIYEPGEHEISYTQVFPGTVPDSAIEVQSRSPDTIRVTVERKASKKLNVEVEYRGAVPQGYLTDEANIQLSAKTVHISGPQSLVDAAVSAKIIIDLTNCTETISQYYQYSLLDASGNLITNEGIRSDVAFIHVSLQIRQLKEVPITFDVIYGGGATPSNTKIQVSMESIQVSGHKNILKDVAYVYLGEIVLAEKVDSGNIVLPVELPSGVRNETNDQEVTVTVTFTGLEKKTLWVTNIKAVNVPEGMVATFVDKKLQVKLRGTKEELAEIDASKVTVLVDFSSTREGTSSMPAKIVVDAGDHSNVGAIGIYTLIADMRRAE
jgi:YbbR domain-containing protein